MGSAVPDAPRGAVVLIGMMGAGKTTVGSRLARRLGWRYVDNDLAIEADAGMSVANIFATFGEEDFRRREAAFIRDALAGVGERGPVVLSVGGGAVLRPETQEAVRDAGAEVVWLRAPVDVLVERVARRRQERPLIAGDDPEATMRRIYAEREPVYEAVSTRVVDVSTAGPDDIARAIEEWFR